MRVIPKPSQDSANVAKAQAPELPLGEVVEPLMMTEIAQRWGWNYNTTHSRLKTAFRRGQLTQLKRAGHQPYYLAHQVAAIFGPPPRPDPGLRVLNGGDDPVKATYGGRSEYELRRRRAA